MSSILESLTSQLGGAELGQLAGLLGADQRQTESAVPAAVATLLGALGGNAQKHDGADALHRALGKDHDGSLLDNLGGFLGSGQTGMGESILRHVLGGRQASVESELSKSTGLDSRSIAKLLSMLAPMVLAYLGKQQRQQGLNAGGLADLLGHERRQIRRQPPANLGVLGGLLDQDGDGDVKDDLAKAGIGILGKLFRRR